MEEKVKIEDIIDPLGLRELVDSMQKRIDEVDGKIPLDEVASITERVRDIGARYYSPDNKPTPGDIGASPSGHTHTAADVGASPASHTHTASDVGASPAGHTHTLASLGAAASGHNHNGVYAAIGHTHTASEVGASPAGHTHTASDVGASPAGHTHTASDIGAAPASHTHAKSEVGLSNVDNVKQYSASNKPTPADIGALAASELLTKIYPVGAIYISVSQTSPASFIGGTWERIKDRFLLAAGDTYGAGSTGGSADAVVVEHTHAYILRIDAGTGNNSEYPSKAANHAATAQKFNTGMIQSAGESGVGKNMPPYVAVYMWKRTA